MQKMFIKLVAATIIIMHLVSFIFEAELWPFSYYPMYSRPLLNEEFKTFHFVLSTDKNNQIRLHHMSQIFPIGPHCIINCVDKLIHSQKLHFLLDQIYTNCTRDKGLCHMDHLENIKKISLMRVGLYKDENSLLKVRDYDTFIEQNY